MQKLSNNDRSNSKTGSSGSIRAKLNEEKEFRRSLSNSRKSSTDKMARRDSNRSTGSISNKRPRSVDLTEGNPVGDSTTNQPVVDDSLLDTAEALEPTNILDPSPEPAQRPVGNDTETNSIYSDNHSQSQANEQSNDQPLISKRDTYSDLGVVESVRSFHQAVHRNSTTRLLHPDIPVVFDDDHEREIRAMIPPEENQERVSHVPSTTDLLLKRQKSKDDISLENQFAKEHEVHSQFYCTAVADVVREHDQHQYHEEIVKKESRWDVKAWAAQKRERHDNQHKAIEESQYFPPQVVDLIRAHDKHKLEHRLLRAQSKLTVKGWLALRRQKTIHQYEDIATFYPQDEFHRIREHDKATEKVVLERVKPEIQREKLKHSLSTSFKRALSK
eukprot:c9005_g1_i2.p1 GENE.c9005_g1_i2~~c9005_g1_i2.p1  ORF type:complete len:388 (-),score=35.42 c9005_g1_i2:37-1200(-)